MKSIKVMVIDDSAVVRQVLSDIINAAEGMEVIGVAIDPIFAQKKLRKIRPDVITLDVEMPRMDGLTFLADLMRDNPIPVVMCSKLTQQSAPESLRALSLGAVEIVAKPLVNLKHDLALQNREIVRAIRVAAAVCPERLRASTPSDSALLAVPEKLTADAVMAKQAPGNGDVSTRLIALGASTGGTQAIEFLLSRLGPQTPGIAVVQHMPAEFTVAFAERLDSLSPLRVKQAENGDRFEPGMALIAPGDHHLVVENHEGILSASVRPGPQVCRHCPSVDVLFRSAAQAAGPETLGIILTGMGDDGAHGMKELFDAGAFTIAQDEASCVVFGMPARAIEEGGVSTTCSLEGLPLLMSAFDRPRDFANLVDGSAATGLLAKASIGAADS